MIDTVRVGLSVEPFGDSGGRFDIAQLSGNVPGLHPYDPPVQVARIKQRMISAAGLFQRQRKRAFDKGFRRIDIGYKNRIRPRQQTHHKDGIFRAPESCDIRILRIQVRYGQKQQREQFR